MPYAIRTDMEARYGEEELIQLTDRDNLGQINDAVLTQALTDADDEINAYLAGRYSVPVTPVPKVLTRVACAIARYRLYDAAAPERVAKDYEADVRFLRDVANGVVKLGVDASQQPVASPSGIAVKQGVSGMSWDTY